MIKRYSSRRISAIFSERSKYENWLKIEILLIRYLSSKGHIEKKDAEDLISGLFVTPSLIRKEELKTKHDVVAFINYLCRISSSKEKRWIHYGLTSSDLVDTGNSMMLKKANIEIFRQGYRLLKRLKKLAHKHRHTYQLERRNGKVEDITVFGYSMALHYASIKEALEFLDKVRRHVECASLSGSVGISSYIDPEFQDYAASELNLFSSKASTQVLSRDRYYTYLVALNTLGQSINKLSIELRKLSRTEISEISECFGKDQIGSSSMPHKKNPISLENICGLSRLLEGYVVSAEKNIPLWLERDISHSSVDRVVFLDATTITYQILKKMSEIVEKMYVDKDRMKKNLDKWNHVVYRRRIKNLLISKTAARPSEIDYYLEKMHEHAEDHGHTFEEVFRASGYAEKLLETELNKLFEYEWDFKYIDAIYKRIFKDSLDKSYFDNVYYEKFEIDYAIEILAQKLNYEYRNETSPVQLIAFTDGAITFLTALATKFKFRCTIKAINMSLMKYMILNKEDTKEIKLDIEKSDIEGKRVLIIDDLINTGTTISSFKSYIKKFNALDIKTCVLFSIPNKDIIDQVDYCGLLVPSAKDIAGFGMDVNGKYRNLSCVGKISADKIS